jgi:hypothetical protein
VHEDLGMIILKLNYINVHTFELTVSLSTKCLHIRRVICIRIFIIACLILNYWTGLSGEMVKQNMTYFYAEILCTNLKWGLGNYDP